MKEDIMYDIFNYSVANILNSYLHTVIKEIQPSIVKNGVLVIENAKIYFSSFTGDFQGSIAMFIDTFTEKTLTEKFLQSFSNISNKVYIFDEILNIIISQFSNALEYDTDYTKKSILHSPPILIEGRDVHIKMFDDTRVFNFILDEGSIRFAMGLKR